jgi:hypothetical protein
MRGRTALDYDAILICERGGRLQAIRLSDKGGIDPRSTERSLTYSTQKTRER